MAWYSYFFSSSDMMTRLIKEMKSVHVPPLAHSPCLKSMTLQTYLIKKNSFMPPGIDATHVVTVQSRSFEICAGRLTLWFDERHTRNNGGGVLLLGAYTRTLAEQ